MYIMCHRKTLDLQYLQTNFTITLILPGYARMISDSAFTTGSDSFDGPQ